MSDKFKVYEADITDFKPDPKNHNKHTAKGHKMVTNSMQKRGYARPAFAANDGTVLGGNLSTMEVAPAVGLGDGKVIVIETDGDIPIIHKRRDVAPGSTEAKQLSYEDNISSAFDFSMDSAVVMSDIEAGFDFAAIDVSLPDLGELLKRDVAELLGGNKGKNTEPQISKAEELQEVWQVKPGQMFACGEHRIICGDCTDRAVVEKVMAGENARFEFSDPPYEFETKGGGILENSAHMDAIEKAGINTFDPLSITLFASTSVFCCNKTLIPLYINLAENNKQSWDLCFYKKENTPPNFGGHLMTDTEYLPVIGKQSPNSGMEKQIYSKCYIGGLDDGHLVAWQKPVKLVEKFVRLFSDCGDIILDRFIGTGTTLIACHNLNRRCRGIEISPAYCSVVLQRFLDHTGIQPVLL